VARAASLCQRRHRPTTPWSAPKRATAKDGGTYVLGYRDWEHVNESGDGGLPV